MAEEMGKNPKGAGKSSFELIDLKKISDVLPVKPGSVVLDLACGRGDYSVYFSEIVGDRGLVYALDLWEEGRMLLEKRNVIDRHGLFPSSIQTGKALGSHAPKKRTLSCKLSLQLK